MSSCRRSVGIYQETSLHSTRHGNTQPQSSQLVEPLWTDPGLKSGISVRELISTLKKKKEEKRKGRRGLIGRTFSQTLASDEKATAITSPLHRSRLQAILHLCVRACVCMFSSPFLFFFKVEISSRTLIPLFMPGSDHSG